MRLPIFEQDGEPAEEGSFNLEASDPSLCGGQEVNILYLRYYQRYYLRYYLRCLGYHISHFHGLSRER